MLRGINIDIIAWFTRCQLSTVRGVVWCGVVWCDAVRSEYSALIIDGFHDL